MSITPLPSAPAITDTTSEFNTKAFNWVAALDPFTTEANALLATCEDAAMTAAAAIALVGAEAWVSGTTYAIGDSVYSPIDMQTYRRKTNGAGTTDPSADSTNWEKIAFNAVTATQEEMEAGTSTTIKSMTPSLINQAIQALTPPPKSKTWTLATSSTTYTVPSGVTSIRAYAIGAGGNGGYTRYGSSTAGGSGGGGGGGGGCAYGDIAVTPGQTVTVTISNGVATVSYGGTTLLTANKGGDGSNGYAIDNMNPPSGGAGGAGGTATKHASVTNGGAYTGGAGGNGGNGLYQYGWSYYGGSGGGGSAASPLGVGGAGGTGSNNSQSYIGGGGGGGIGGAGGNGYYTENSGGGGGAGGAGGTSTAGAGSAGGGAGGAASGTTAGAGRYFYNYYTDPLLATATADGSTGMPGAGGSGIGTSVTSFPNGGLFGGGGGTASGGATGGLLGGGGGSKNASGVVGGNGGYGGGGGGGVSSTGTGGGAIVLIYA